MDSNSQAPPPPPGYPTAAAGAEQQGGARKGRRGKTTSRGEKGFIEGWCHRGSVLLLDLRDVLRLAASPSIGL
nr:unnamed protein product [Digitaria exilis]